MPLKRLDLTLQKHKNYAVYAVMRLIQLIINKIKAAWFTKNYAVSVAGTMPSRFLDGLCV